jgi:hypothetical protein
MINREENIVEWALLMYELEDAREALVELLAATNAPDFDESEFGIQLAHIYSHLNRAWNRRAHLGEQSDADFQRFSDFPKDLHPLRGQLSPPDSEAQ